MLAVMMMPLVASCGKDDDNQDFKNVVIVDKEVIPIVNVECGYASYAYLKGEEPSPDEMPRNYRVFLDKEDWSKHYINIGTTNNLNGVKRDKKNDFDVSYIDKNKEIEYYFLGNPSIVTDDSYIMLDDHDKNNIVIEINIKYYRGNVIHSISCYYKGPESPRAYILQ